jgi:hypothetical protein
MPYIFAGLRISLGVGWVVLIASEMLAQNPGLGKFIWDEFQNGSSQSLARIMVAVFTIGGYAALMRWGFEEIHLEQARTDGWVAFHRVVVCKLLPKNFESIVLARDESDEGTWIRLAAGQHFTFLRMTWVEPRRLRIAGVSLMPPDPIRQIGDVTIDWEVPR